MTTLRDKVRARSLGEGHSGRPLVSPGDEPKSGCRYCPLFCWSHDFEVASKGGYFRQADKIRVKETERHTVRTRCVEEHRWNKVDVLFVGEAPGADEDREGEPFVGRSGKLLREALASMSSVKADQCGITNVVRCRPPRNRTPNKTEMQSCSPRLLAEIKAREPKIIVALGNVPLGVLTGNSGITNYSGRIMPCTLPGFEAIKVVGCLHPAYVLRADFEIERFIQAFEVVQALLAGEVEEKKGAGKYRVVSDLDTLSTLMRRLTKSKAPVAVDTETGALSPFQTQFPRLLCFSFSDKEGEGWVVPFDHPESPWRKTGPKRGERKLVKRLLRRFMVSNVPKVLQNGKYDALHIRAALGVELLNYQDTMLTHLVLDERHGTHGLDQHAWNYSGMGGYDKPLDAYKKSHREANPTKGGSYANIPAEILFPYAAMDADVTLRTFNGLRQEEEYVKNRKLRAIADTFLPALSEALTDMEFQGAQVDLDQVGKLDVLYRAEMTKNERAIYQLKKVRSYQKTLAQKGKKPRFNPGSTQQLGDVLFGLYEEKPVELTDKGFESLTLRYTRSVQSWRKKRSGEKPQFSKIVAGAIKREQWVHFSTKADVLHELSRRGNQLAPLILQWRSAETLHKTFVKPMSDRLDEYGRVHGTFSIFGTVTGRLASYDPNLQNIPNKGGGLIKRAYVSRFGSEGVIGQVDYSQIELRVAACRFHEPTMMKAYRQGADLHLLTALDISRMTLEEYKALDSHKAKEIRTQAKRVNFGILYGGGPPALMAALKKDGVFLTIDECKALIQRYFEVRPKLKEGIEALEADVCKTGYLESFTGRRRRVPEVFSENKEIVSRALRQSVNFPIQNGASEMTLMSLVLIWREMRRRNYRSKMILTVHDSIVFDLHVDEAFEVLTLAKYIMENLPKLSDHVLPGLDWTWLKVPLVADCDIGFTWGTLVEVKNPSEPDIDELWGEMEAKMHIEKVAA